MKLLNLKYLSALICAFHTYAVGYEVYQQPPFLLIDIHSTGSKSTLINFNQYNLWIYIWEPHFVTMYPHFRKAKFCGVLSLAIVTAGCAVGKKIIILRNTGLLLVLGTYFMG
jgi:hypothetical protein